MSKFNVQAVLDDVKKLYARDKKSQDMLLTGDAVRQEYTKDDGIPATELYEALTSLPCVPFDKISQFAGDTDTGKSTSLSEIMASAQKAGFAIIEWDAEDKFDANRYKTQFGGDPKEMFLVKTNEILQGGEKVRKIVTSLKEKYPDAKIAIFWDSVGGSQSRSHAERELDDEKHGQPGQDAKENGAVMKMLVALINKYPGSIVVVLANQVYSKIGFMQHGNTQSGGKKVAFHSSLIVELKRIKTLTKVVKGAKVKTGILTRATVSKNHLSQTANSVYQMDFEITAKGAKPAGVTANDEAEDEE